MGGLSKIREGKKKGGKGSRDSCIGRMDPTDVRSKMYKQAAVSPHNRLQAPLQADSLTGCYSFILF